MSNKNLPVEGAYQFFPDNEPQIGSLLSEEHFVQNANVPLLFQPLVIKGVEFHNRVFVSPMCQYSSDNGHATDWHFVHIGAFATRGIGGICMEATAVLPEGRISPEDAGLWADTQMEPLKRIVDFAHAHGAKIGIQLAHAGRKASTLATWVHAHIATGKIAPTFVAQETEGGWPDNVWGPSDIPYSDQFPKVKPVTEEYMKLVEDAFVTSIERCKKIGFDFIELHYAHGYLFSTFASPLSNNRSDEWGGQPLENRLRWPLRVADICRKAWDGPLFVRINGSDWAEGPEKGDDGLWKQWGIEQSKTFAGELLKLGIDLVDVSSGGLWAQQKITIKPGYQSDFALAIKKEHPSLLIGSVGLITSPKQAEQYLQEGKADVIFMAREFIRSPNWVFVAAEELGVAVKPANQYERGFTRMFGPKH